MIGEIHIALNQPKMGKTKIDARLKLFHYLMVSQDSDWPYADMVTACYRYNKTKVCKECKGRVYMNPRFTPAQIKALARQLKVPVRITRFAQGSRCKRQQFDIICASGQIF